jgi:hypothetical protein
MMGNAFTQHGVALGAIGARMFQSEADNALDNASSAHHDRDPSADDG